MKELELTSNAALTDVVYEAALNGSLLNVKLVTGAVGDDEIRGLIPEANHYHVTHPKTSEEILFEQPLDASDNKVPVYGLGALIQSPTIIRPGYQNCVSCFAAEQFVGII